MKARLGFSLIKSDNLPERIKYEHHNQQRQLKYGCNKAIWKLFLQDRFFEGALHAFRLISFRARLTA